MRVHDIILQLRQEQGRQTRQIINKIRPPKHIPTKLERCRILRRQDLQLH